MDAFYALAVLACPLGMGLMMWFMMKGNRPQGGTPAPHAGAAGHAGFTTDPRRKEVEALRAEVDSLRARLDDRPAAGRQEQERAR
ncbi:DUF2933 domain-containing protein [Streptomyces sp. YIM 98790]|uniref:DUF2933 domain-containing protein n=1 Tax=Streptomyces sp. YIM 98790 TaxID=2689077 RepID=UPI001A9F6F7A|nr:DUF2933 domain-containing protein [Streptomyces sp. YIM 98790]